MWESNESVFDLIKPRNTPPRARDKAPKAITSVRNLLWKMKNNLNLRDAATFGYPPSRSVPRPCRGKFLRKHSKEPQLHCLKSRKGNEGGSLPDRCTSKKAPLPDLHNNPPKYGLKSDTDYITANAVVVIRAKPNRPKKEEPPTSPGFGRIPAYLAKRKEQTRSTSKGSPQKNGKCHHPGTRRLEDDEKQTIVNGLKIKWANVNAEYLRLPFIADTDAKAIRKNGYEQELENLQRDISMLSRKVVVVSDQKGLPSKVKPPLQ